MMKRVISIILSTLLLCAACVVPASAAEKRNVAYGKKVTSRAPGGFYEATQGAGGYEDYRAVDGDTRTLTSLQAVTYAAGEEIWLKVDLGNYYTISEIQIAARTDTQGYPPGETGSIQILASVNDEAPSAMTLLGTVPSEGITWCESYTQPIDDATKYRYVALYRNGGSHMSLSELSVYTEDDEPEPLDELVNVAQGKSYIYSGSILGYEQDGGKGYGPQNIVDGDTETAMYMSSFGWVMVDLGDWYAIEKIEFVTGPWEEGTVARSNANIYAHVINDINSMTLIGSTPEEPSLSTLYSIESLDKTTKYRYVAIMSNNPYPDRLFCSELRVLVKDLTGQHSQNVAVGKKITTSTMNVYNYANDNGAGYGPQNIVDGSADSGVFMLESGWIKVDLGNWYAIDKIEFVTGAWDDGVPARLHTYMFASVDDVDVSQMTQIGSTPEPADDLTTSTLYTIDPTDKTTRYRYVAIQAADTTQGRLLCMELRVFATVDDDIGPWSITKDDVEVSTASVGDSLSFSATVRNFDYVGGKKPYMLYVAAYDENNRLISTVSGVRLYKEAGTHTLTAAYAVPEGAAECRCYLIRSLADASLLVDCATVTVQ